MEKWSYNEKYIFNHFRTNHIRCHIMHLFNYIYKISILYPWQIPPYLTAFLFTEIINEDNAKRFLDQSLIWIHIEG